MAVPAALALSALRALAALFTLPALSALSGLSALRALIGSGGATLALPATASATSSAPRALQVAVRIADLHTCSSLEAELAFGHDRFATAIYFDCTESIQHPRDDTYFGPSADQGCAERLAVLR